MEQIGVKVTPFGKIITVLYFVPGGEREGMSTYFVDEYERQLDDRGRIILPAKVREAIGSCVYITRSPAEKCLHLYTQEEWGAMSERLRELPVTLDRNAAAFVRIFFGTAASCEVDKQGRISVGKRLCDFAGLTKDVVLVGVNTRLEIWSKEEWTAYNESISEDVILEGIEKYGLII